MGAQNVHPTAHACKTESSGVRKIQATTLMAQTPEIQEAVLVSKNKDHT